MANAAKAQVDLESQPFLSFKGVELVPVNSANFSNGTVQPSIIPRLKIGNPGKVLVSYNVEEIHSSLSN